MAPKDLVALIEEDLVEDGVPLGDSPSGYIYSTEEVGIDASPFFIARKLSDLAENMHLVPITMMSMSGYVKGLLERRRACEALGVQLSNSWHLNTVHF